MTICFLSRGRPGAKLDAAWGKAKVGHACVPCMHVHKLSTMF